MADLRIEQLTLRIRRRGGWSWGPSPQAWVRAAEHALPELLVSELGALLDRRGLARVRGRWTVRVKLRASDLPGLMAAATDAGIAAGAGGSGPASAPRARAAIRSALARGLVELGDGRLVARRDVDGTPERSQDGEADSDFADLAGISIATMLRRWRSRGVLLSTLRDAAPGSIERWHDALLGSSARRSASPAPEDERLARAATAIVAGLTSPGSMTLHARRILVAVILADQEGVEPADASILCALERVLPIATTGPAEEADANATSYGRESRAAESSGISPPLQRQRTPSTEAVIHVASVLPFLALGVLDRLGWVAAALQAVPRADAASWAAAFAYKLAGTPRRGWQRSPHDERLAAAFAGGDAPVPETGLVELASELEGRLSSVDAVLREVLLTGRSANDACIVVPTTHAGRPGMLACEVLGCFPIAWVHDADELAVALAPFASGPVVVPGPAVAPVTLSALHAAGLTFVTDVPPTRGERWSSARASGTRAWSNAAGEAASTVASALATARREETAARAVAAWQALDERPSVARAAAFDLDRSFTLGAGVALATIAWVLWRGREATDCSLALQRFGDLEGSVSFDAEGATVRIPRGRRRDDLLAHGFLAPVDGLAWLGGRLVFGVA